MMFPKVLALREDELISGATQVVPIAVELMPELPRHIALLRTTLIDQTPVLHEPLSAQFDVDFANVETINLLDPLTRPNVDGTIYIKKQEELFEQGSRRTKVSVE